MLAVLFFHSRKALPGGYLGVDLFFVLSGYLITSLLLAEHRDTGRIALWPFWMRRARRLFPALLSLLPAVAVYAWLLAKPDELARIRGDALATLGYVANWRAIWSHKSYWELFAAPSPLEHTWSLSIEEQFYVVWPVVVMVLLRRGTKRPLLWLTRFTLAAGVLSAIAMAVMFEHGRTSRVYLGTDTRMAGILAGAALAMFLPPGTTLAPSTARQIDRLGIVAALGLGVAWCTLPGESAFLYRGGFWLTEVCALILIMCSVAGPRLSVVARVLAWRPLRLIGAISYGLYLWHWPVNVVLTQERVHVGGWMPLVRFFVTFAIAIVSYRFLERPIRSRGLPFGRSVYVVPAAVALSLLLVVRATHARPQPRYVMPPPLATSPPAPDAPPQAPFKILVLGDSTANSLGWTIRGVQRPGVVLELMGKDGCTMLYDGCRGEEWADYTREHRPDATLFFVGGAFEHELQAKNGRYVKSCHPEWDARFRRMLVKRLSDLVAPTTRVWVVTTPYVLGEVWGGKSLNQEIDCINTTLRNAASEVRGVEVVELGERLCPKGDCKLQSEGTNIRTDGLHYDMAGARALSAWVLDEIQPGSSRPGSRPGRRSR